MVYENISESELKEKDPRTVGLTDVERYKIELLEKIEKNTRTL